MNIYTPFIVPVAHFENTGIKDLARPWFFENEFKDMLYKGKTTIQDYIADDKFFPVRSNNAEIFDAKLIGYAKQFLITVGYDIEEYNPVIHRMWLVEMTAGAITELHSHFGNVISGCCYIDIPDGSGRIEFFGQRSTLYAPAIPIKTHTVFNSATWAFSPKEDDIYMWESHLGHTVPAQEFEGVRRSLAFDIRLEKRV